MSSVAIITLLLTVALGPGGQAVEQTVSLPGSPRADRPMAQWRLPGAEPRPAAGKLLVARAGMRDPNFSETVVLLIAYDEGGALGLVVNRRAEVELREILPEIEGLKERDDPVYFGGPVNRTRMFILTRTDAHSDFSRPVVDGVHVGENKELLDRLLADREAPEFRAFAGYAGWGAGQLDGEIEAGGWHIVAGSAERIFMEPPSALWRSLLPRNEMEWSRLVPSGK